jgi:prepilin-type N-terminal cleavage/methylation domain-containing protein
MRWVHRRRLGHSLVEVLIALLIIAILMGLFLPAAWELYKAALRLGE